MDFLNFRFAFLEVDKKRGIFLSYFFFCRISFRILRLNVSLAGVFQNLVGEMFGDISRAAFFS